MYNRIRAPSRLAVAGRRFDCATPSRVRGTWARRRRRITFGGIDLGRSGRFGRVKQNTCWAIGRVTRVFGIISMSSMQVVMMARIVLRRDQLMLCIETTLQWRSDFVWLYYYCKYFIIQNTFKFLTELWCFTTLTHALLKCSNFNPYQKLQRQQRVVRVVSKNLQV